MKYVVVVDPFLYIFVFCNNVTIITKPPGFVIVIKIFEEKFK